jgi:hypothetical protein
MSNLEKKNIRTLQRYNYVTYQESNLQYISSQEYNLFFIVRIASHIFKYKY